MTFDVEGRNPGIAHFAPLFAYAHLPEGQMRNTSSHCARVAEFMVGTLPDGPELTAGLRKLLEAKDCFVRAAMAARADGESR